MSTWAKRQIWRLRLAALGPILHNLALLDEWQTLPSADLKRLQVERLERLLAHAYRSTDYYRRMLAAHEVVSSDGKVRLERFSRLPLLDKTLLRDNFEAMKSSDLDRRRWYVNTSGGSTGEPAHFVQDREFDAWVAAVKLQFDAWTGCGICDRKVVLWGSPGDIDGSGDPLRARLGRWLSNELWLRADDLTEADMIAYAKTIDVVRPVQLLAYADRIYEFARVIEQRGTRVRPPRSIMTSAGTLYPAMREVIERAFGAPVFNRYGSREVGDIACDCDRHEGLHVSAPCQHVEVLRPDGTPAGAGEEGEIVITSLVNFAMPLIRYRIGDLGVWSAEPCGCGRTWPRLARVSGRTTDVFVKPDGALVGGDCFFFLFEGYDWLRRFQLVQESVDRVEVYLQTYSNTGDIEPGQRQEIVSTVRRAMGGSCAVTVNVVREIGLSPSGKHLCMISKVRSQQEARK